MMVVDDVKLLVESKNNRQRMPFKEIELLFLPMQAPRFALFLYLAHPNSDLRWAQSLYWHGLENGIAYKDHDELLRLWIVSAQTSTVEEVGYEFMHTSLRGRPMSALGHSLPIHLAPVPANVRYYPKGDLSRRSEERRVGKGSR